MIPPMAIALIKEYEGLELKAYKDPVGIWTIGYGCTRINGRPVKERDVLANAQHAETILLLQLNAEYLPKLRIIPGWDNFNDYQKAALISFAWNLGAYFYGHNDFATITKSLRLGDRQGVARAIKLYNKGGGRVLPGLVRRREKEAELFLREDNSPPPKEETPVGLNYFLDFTMGLDLDGRLEDGRLVLRSLSDKGGRTHQVWVATTSIASRQKPEDFHQRGGPIPPEYRVPSLRAWEVETTPINLSHVKGIEGNFYKILPFAVTTDKGGQRSDLGIHYDGNVPGSLGCIVMSGDRFKSFEGEMRRLKDQAIAKVPLFVTYPTS